MIDSRRSIILHICFLAFPLCVASSQPFLQKFNPFTVVQQSDTLINPFSGGLETPIHQFVDLDGDGDLDLFVLDRDNRLAYYLNEGSPTNPRFRLAFFEYPGVEVGSWFRFVDIDADGDADLFCNAPAARVRFYRNQGTPSQAMLVKEAETLPDSSGSDIISEEISHPAFADVDGDGDQDFLSGNSTGTITFYENVGSPTSFLFKFKSSQYQGISIIGGGGQVGGLRVPAASTADRRLHGAMALALKDLDNDGDPDMFWGDFFNKSLYFLRNEGTPTAPQFVLRDSTFSDESPVLSNGFNMPTLEDIDSDGDPDLFIGVLSLGTSRNNFLFYRNNGSPSQHSFALVTQNFLPTIDGSATSVPVAADVDKDGRIDVLVGGEDGSLTVFRNTTSVAGVELTLETERLVDLPGLFNIAPAVGDLNGDGKPDLLIGDFNGRLRLWHAVDTGYVPVGFQLDSLVFGLNAAPALADVDDDQRLDLFVGTGGGRIQYFRNQGSPTSPDFVLQTDFFLSLDVGDDAKPAFADVDGDGDLDLVVGGVDGNLTYLRNDGSASVFSFTPVPAFFSGVTAVYRAAPAWIDADGDGDLDLILGNGKGGLYYFENRRIVVSAPRADLPPTGVMLLQNYPNPFNPRTTIRYQLAEDSEVRLSVFDVLGRNVETLVEGRVSSGWHEVTWEAATLPSGIYFSRLSVKGMTISRRMILLR